MRWHRCASDRASLIGVATDAELDRCDRSARSQVFLIVQKLLRSSRACRPCVKFAGMSCAHWGSLGHSAGRRFDAPCSGQRFCSRFCVKCRTRGTGRLWPRRPAAGQRNAGVLPRPNTPFQGIATSPAVRRWKCYPCVRYDLPPCLGSLTAQTVGPSGARIDWGRACAWALARS